MSPLYDLQNNNSDIHKRIDEIIGSVNIHKHTSSCHEGTSGKLCCRFAYPIPLNTIGTRQLCIELEENSIEPKQIQRVDTSNMSIENQIQEQIFYNQTMEELKKTTKKYYTCKEVIGPIQKINSFCKKLYGSNSKSPLPPKDTRNIVYELQRSELKEVSKDEIEESSASKCIRKDMNKRVVSFNETLTSVLCSNTAIYHLGVTETSKCISEYLGTYLTKDIVSLKAVLAAGNIYIICSIFKYNFIYF
jgi:hypothetical protein